MHDLYYGDTYVLKKKANYRERLTCGILSMDNVYKLYEWDEDTVAQGKRLIRLQQYSPMSMRMICCS